MAKIHDIFSKLAAEEDSFTTREFLSPVIRGRPVRVKIAGVVMTLEVTRPKNFAGGWGVMVPTSFKEARFLRVPNMREQQQYLDLFPKLRLVICGHDEASGPLGILANNDKRFRISGLVPVHLSTEVQQFDTVVAAFDGSIAWFQRVDNSLHPRNPAILREAISKLTDIAKVTDKNLSAEEHRAYAIAFARELDNRRDHQEDRIKDALERAGAEYRSYVDRGNSYTVEYMVDGERHHSVVDKQTLGVQSAGICLSGGDQAFDLQSLVCVIREGIHGRRIVNVPLRDPTTGYEEDNDDDDDDD